MAENASNPFGNRRLNFVLILVGLLVLGAYPIITIGSGGGTPAEQCLNPPTLGLPNTCHIYTWRNFPTRTDHYAINGLFGNDSSYYFMLNSTSMVAFDICVNGVQFTDNLDATLIPQILTPPNTGEWQDLHGSFLHDNLGGVNLDFGQSCSGYTPINATLISTGFINNEQNFRIAGEQNQNLSSGGVSNPQFSELTVQLFFNRTVTTIGSAQASITCVTGTVATNGFTGRCTLGAGTATSNTVVTMNWEANLSGASFQSGSGSCTILAGGQQCSKAFPFSPTFPTPPSVILDWNPGIAGINLPAPSIVQVSTIINILT